MKARTDKLEAHIKTQEQELETYHQEKAKVEQAVQALRDEETLLQDDLHKQKEKLAAKNEAVNKARAELQKRSKEVDSRTKAIASLETEVQSNSAGRYALLRRCKLEQIAIPLVDGSKQLSNLPDDNLLQNDPDAMDVDEADEDANALAKDYGIEVDFDELDDDLKNVSVIICMIRRLLISIARRRRHGGDSPNTHQRLQRRTRETQPKHASYRPS